MLCEVGTTGPVFGDSCLPPTLKVSIERRLGDPQDLADFLDSVLLFIVQPNQQLYLLAVKSPRPASFPTPRAGCRKTCPKAAVLTVENGWFVDGKKVMAEVVRVRVHRATEDSRSIDFDFTWTPTDKPVTLQGAGGKSYGGLTMRFAPRSRQDTVITVPSGRTQADLPETRLKWADFTSKFGDATAPSGAAVFVPADHPDYPPTWLTRHYGPLCVGWPGVSAKTFQPGEPIQLTYRIWIHKTAVDVKTLKRAYEAYVAEAKRK